MAIRFEDLSPIRQARVRRRELPRYLRLDVSRSLLIAVVMLCLMSLIALGQTGVVATKGYAIVELEARRTELLRRRSQLQLEYAAAQDLKRIYARAAEIGLRPTNNNQIRYIVLPAETVSISQAHDPLIDSQSELQQAERPAPEDHIFDPDQHNN